MVANMFLLKRIMNGILMRLVLATRQVVMNSELISDLYKIDTF